MSRAELIKKLKQSNKNLNITEIEAIIDAFSVCIENALINKKNIQLRDFGTFFIKKIKEKYSARNPKTGEIIYVPEKNKVRFKASKNLNKIINK